VTASLTTGRALRYAGGSARGLLHQLLGHGQLVSQFEAATLSTPELYGLRKEAFIAFTAAPRGSQKQREALVTMQTIEAELATRAPGL